MQYNDIYMCIYLCSRLICNMYMHVMKQYDGIFWAFATVEIDGCPYPFEQVNLICHSLRTSI